MEADLQIQALGLRVRVRCHSAVLPCWGMLKEPRQQHCTCKGPLTFHSAQLLLVGAVLCIVGCSTVSLASTHGLPTTALTTKGWITNHISRRCLMSPAGQRSLFQRDQDWYFSSNLYMLDKTYQSIRTESGGRGYFVTLEPHHAKAWQDSWGDKFFKFWMSVSSFTICNITGIIPVMQLKRNNLQDWTIVTTTTITINVERYCESASVEPELFPMPLGESQEQLIWKWIAV